MTNLEQDTHKRDKENSQSGKEKKEKSREERLDEGLAESFPASDPPAVTREPIPKKD